MNMNTSPKNPVFDIATTAKPETPCVADPLEDRIGTLRHDYIEAINADQQSIEMSAAQTDSHYLNIGKHVCAFIAAGMAAGATSEDALFRRLIEKGSGCRVNKGALYNARSYYQMHTAMAKGFNEAPALPMTYYTKVRSKHLALADQHELLKQALMGSSRMSCSELGRKVRERLANMGVTNGQKQLMPVDGFQYWCTRAHAAMMKIETLLEQGKVPSDDSAFMLRKAAMKAGDCVARLDATVSRDAATDHSAAEHGELRKAS